MKTEPGWRAFSKLRWLLLAGGLCFLLLTPSSAAAANLASPSRLIDDYDARLTTADGQLWLAVLGTDRLGHYRIETHRFDGRDWKTLAGRPATPYEKDLRFAVVDPTTGPAIPCVGDSPHDRARIRCFRDGDWKEMALDPSLAGMVLTGLRADGPVLTGLFTSWNQDGSSTIAVGRSDGGAFEAVGPDLPVAWRVLSYLGTRTDDLPGGQVDVSLQTWSGRAGWPVATVSLGPQGWTGFRTFFALGRGAWATEPVRSADGLFLPAMKARRASGGLNSAATFLYRATDRGWSRASGNWGSASGFNSGWVYPVGRRVWSVWTRLWGNPRKRIQARLFAARVSPDGRRHDRKIVLRRKYDGAGYTAPQAVEFRNRPTFLYARSINGRWRATVVLPHR